MALMAATLGVVIGVPIYDYLAVTGPAAQFTSFNYQYWPPSNLRRLAIALLAAGVFATFAIMHPPEPDSRIWVILPAAIGIIIHCCMSIIDIFRQKRNAANTGKVR